MRSIGPDLSSKREALVSMLILGKGSKRRANIDPDSCRANPNYSICCYTNKQILALQNNIHDKKSVHIFDMSDERNHLA